HDLRGELHPPAGARDAPGQPRHRHDLHRAGRGHPLDDPRRGGLPLRSSLPARGPHRGLLEVTPPRRHAPTTHRTPPSRSSTSMTTIRAPPLPVLPRAHPPRRPTDPHRIVRTVHG